MIMAREWTPVRESQHQTALMQWWDVVHNRYGLPEKALYHPPNEGLRSRVTGALLKKLGLRKGFPDIQLLTPAPAPSTYGMLFIELKSEHGKPSQDQLDYLEFLRGRGYAACLCYGWDAAKRCIEDYLDGCEIPEKM